MSVRRTPRVLSAAGLVAAFLAPAATAGTTAAAVGVVPLLQRASVHFAAPPTTSRCVQDIGLACYSPNQLEEAYDMPALYARGHTGKGKTIVLVDSYGSPTIGHDLHVFDRAFHLPDPQLAVLQPEGAVPPFDPSSATQINWAVESTLDVEYSHAMAPQANIVLVETPVAETEGLVGIPQLMAAENYVIDHGIGDVISQSFGATEETFPSHGAILGQRSAFLNAQAHNVTVLAASGDAGSTDWANAAGTRLYTHRVNSWPSTDPLVTSVGGTQLHLDNSGDRTMPDNVWNDGNILGGAVAGGGGYSSVFRRPDYQAGLPGPNRRITPDVSLSAAVDGGALVYMSFLPAGFYLVGGTSEASPLFAGIVAVADQTAGHDLGLLNPMLYSMGGTSALPDITTGTNTVTFTQNGHTFTVPGYAAVPGYDAASGLGTVDGAKLVRALAHPPTAVG